EGRRVGGRGGSTGGGPHGTSQARKDFAPPVRKGHRCACSRETSEHRCLFASSALRRGRLWRQLKLACSSCNSSTHPASAQAAICRVVHPAHSGFIPLALMTRAHLSISDCTFSLYWSGLTDFPFALCFTPAGITSGRGGFFLIPLKTRVTTGSGAPAGAITPIQIVAS